MQLLRLIAASLSLLVTSSFATTVTYSDSSSFLSHVAAGSYTNAFTGLSSPAGTSAPFSGNGFSYTASSSGGLYLDNGFLGTNLPRTSLSLTFSSANVYAIGANFYDTNLSDAFQSASITLTLSDNTTLTFTPSSIVDGYRGFVSDTLITSLTINAPTIAGLYAGLDNLTVGAAVAQVPEPGSLALLGLGLAGLAVVRRRKQA